MCGVCSLKLVSCGFCGEKIGSGNGYIDFYYEQRIIELASARKFFDSIEFKRYSKIVDKKFNDLINQIKDKVILIW